MNELKKCLEAITNQSDPQEVGAVRPYPVEWDADPNLLGSRHELCTPSMATVCRTNTYTTSNPKLEM